MDFPQILLVVIVGLCQYLQITNNNCDNEELVIAITAKLEKLWDAFMLICSTVS